VVATFKNGHVPYEDVVTIDGFDVCARYYIPRATSADVTLIGLHGLGGHPSAYDREYGRLGSDVGLPLVAVHVPSHGRTSEIPGKVNAAEFVTALICRFIDQVAPGKVIIVGHSLGAALAPFVAARLERATPGRVLGVVMERPPIGTVFMDVRPLVPPVVGYKLMTLGPDLVAQAWYALCLSALQGDGWSYVGSLGEYVRNPPRLVSAVRALWDSQSAIAVLRELQGLNVPVDAIYALGDTAIPVPWRRLLTRNMPARVTVVPGSHSSNILGIGPSYEALLEAVLAGLGRTPPLEKQIRFVWPDPIRLLSELLGRPVPLRPAA
jgi:pimeloyl-ACP methyl ester carboxylesterase